jgi:alpha-mannosidase
MPMNENERRLDRAEGRINELRAWRNAAESPLPEWTLTGADGVRHTLTIGDTWPVIEVPVALHGSGEIPAAWQGQPVKLELWLGGEGLVTLSTGLQHGLSPYQHTFPISDALESGMPLTIDAEVSPKGLFGANVAEPKIERAHVVIPHLSVQALVTDLAIAANACRVLHDHPMVPPLIDAIEDALSILSPAWPTDSETVLNRHLLGYKNPLGSGANSVPGNGPRESADVNPFYADMGVLWSTPAPTGGLEPLPAETLAAIDAAQAFFTGKIERLCEQYPPAGKIFLTGHAHIDLGWLWPTHETRRKLRRTFSTVLSLMERYDDFIFNQSSAQAYAWVEQDDPELFDRIKERIAEGRWDVPGGMWVEPDSEVTGGEAMARQILYGQHYFRQRFGITSRTAWLPDVFGFSGGVPQLLRLGGLTGFFTIKLNWNETNRFPHDLFTWEGIDGSTVTAWMSRNVRSNRGYNADIQPIDLAGSWLDFDGKRYHDEAMVAFGWGDGGGGPTFMQLDRYARLKEYPALPRLRMGTIDAYQETLPGSGLPIWHGELNLELHRGTLTSHGRVKKLNRESETRLVEAEALAVLAALHAGFAYPREPLTTGWQTTLLNQFHDILPGSSIHEVYEDTHRELAGVVKMATGVRDDALSALGGVSGGVLIANATATDRPLIAQIPAGAALPDNQSFTSQSVDGGTLIAAQATVPALGWQPLAAVSSDLAPVDEVRVSATSDGFRLENEIIRVEIGNDGTVHRLTDYRLSREVLADRANQLWGYLDRPRAWDAWDIDDRYVHEGFEIGDVASVEIVESGPVRVAVRVTRNWRSSSIVQTYRLTTGSARLDIVTDIDWQERRVMLRARFPLALRAHESAAETIYGVHHRPTHANTSWQASHFEKSMQRWVDLSETGFGVAILNDGKYAYGASAGELNINLLRSPIYPDHVADRGEHHFTYSLFPHPGGWAEGGVVEEAIALNSPLVTGAGQREHRWGLMEQSGIPLTLGALKQAEDGDGLIIRLHEAHGRRGASILSFAIPLAGIDAVDLLEAPGSDLLPAVEQINPHTVRFQVRPFQIVTLRLRPAG